MALQARDAQHTVPFYPHGLDPTSASASSMAPLPPAASSSLVPGGTLDPQHGSPTSGSSSYPHHGTATAASSRRQPPSHYVSASHPSSTHALVHPHHHHLNASRHHPHHHHSLSAGTANEANAAAAVAMGLEEAGETGNSDPHPQIAGPSSMLLQDQYGGHRPDSVVDAIERLGKDISSQLSTISVQMSSMLSIMSQLVESKRRRFNSPPALLNAPHSADGPGQWQHDLRPVHYRRDSNNPFAFDPAAEGGGINIDHYGSHVHQQQPPATADGSVTHDDDASILVNPQPDHQTTSTAHGLPIQPSSNTHSHHYSVHNQSSAHLELNHSNGSTSMPADHGHATGPSHPADFYSHPMPFQPPVNGHAGKAAAAPADISRQRPASSYGSVRPFTAVDHSQRPPAQNFTCEVNAYGGHHQQQSILEDSEGVRLNFDLSDSNEAANRESSSSDLPHGFARPPTRNPAHRYPTQKDQMASCSSSVPPGASSAADIATSGNGGIAAYPSHPYPATQGRNGQLGTASSSSSSSLTALTTKRVGRLSGASAVTGNMPKKRKRTEDEDGNGDLTSSRPASPSAVSSKSMGDWTFWAFESPSITESRLRELPPARWRTLHAARVDLQRKTGRTMAKLGRLPLRDYLEVPPTEYLAARKTGRAAYQEWLDPLVRLAKQDQHRVKACTNFIEYTHPMLSQCEQNFKAKQLLQQIIDNAIDESTNAKKKAEGGGTNAGGGSSKGGERSASPQSTIFASPGMLSNTSTDSCFTGSGAASGGTGISRFASPRSLTRSSRVERAAASGLQMAHIVDM